VLIFSGSAENPKISVVVPRGTSSHILPVGTLVGFPWKLRNWRNKLPGYADA